jgi:peptide/nickel transport system substrate-binding protein
MRLRSRFLVFVALAAVVGFVAPTAAEAAKSQTPVSGGTLTFAEFSEPSGLDPIVSTGQGTTGAIEMTAVYDTIMRYDEKTKKYLPETAESLTSNADATEWTLKLKPGIKFTDGTDYNADAVIFGINRHRSGLPGAPACATVVACPKNTTSSNVAAGIIKDMVAVDPLTVKITLFQSWTGFPYVLASEPGMIPSPTALKKCDPAAPPKNCAFNLKPVGAGPFMVDSFKVHESITMLRNPNYYGGKVYLDGVTFETFNDSGAAKSFDALKTNQVQAAFLRAPDTVSAAHAAKFPGASTMEQAGNVFLINEGVTITCAGGQPAPLCTGKPDGPTTTSPPTKDPTVRAALVAATNPTVIYQRAYSSQGFPGTCMLQSDFPWYPKTSCPKYNPTQAKKLVAQAKTNGWDGKVRVLCNSSPVAVNVCLAVQAMWQAVGIDPVVDTSKDVTGQITQVVVAHDFDVTVWGLATSPDDGASMALRQNLLSTSQSNRVGFRSNDVDVALNQILAAKTDAEKKALYKTIMTNVYANNPILSFGKVEEYIAWGPKVHGIVQTNRGSVLLGKAWMSTA